MPRLASAVVPKSVSVRVTPRLRHAEKLAVDVAVQQNLLREIMERLERLEELCDQQSKDVSLMRRQLDQLIEEKKSEPKEEPAEPAEEKAAPARRRR